MSLKKSIFLLLFSFSISQASPMVAIDSVEDFSGDIERIIKDNSDRLRVSQKSKEHFVERYFRPWRIEKLSFSAKSAQWGNGYKNKEMFTVKGDRVAPKWFKRQISNSMWKDFGRVSKRAITVGEGELKVFPSDFAFYKNPDEPGEGYPFDYNINSAVKSNLPVFVSHFSKDREWVYVESSTASGWLKVKTVAFVDDKFIKSFMTEDYHINTKDYNDLKMHGRVLASVKMGTLLPKKGSKLVVARMGSKNSARIAYADDNCDVRPLGIDFTAKNVSHIAKNLLGEPYGWGGKDSNRDCSLLTKDFLSSFGIFLERNSRAQSNQGEKIDLSKLSNEEKKRVILEKGIPFMTLLYMNGHVMLYVGEKEGEPMIMHNAWSIKYDNNGKKERWNVQRGVITTLNPGARSINDRYSILSKLKSLVFVNRT